MEKLSEEKERFCREYLLCMDAGRATVAAGYSADAAGAVGKALLEEPGVAQRLDELRANPGEVCALSEAMLMNELKKIAFANIADTRTNWADLKDLHDVPDDVLAAISEIVSEPKMVDGCREAVVKIKFYDKMDAIVRLSKMLLENSKVQNPSFGRAQDDKKAKEQNPFYPSAQMPQVVIMNPHKSS
jgi:hypothetical protein